MVRSHIVSKFSWAPALIAVVLCTSAQAAPPVSIVVDEGDYTRIDGVAENMVGIPGTIPDHSNSIKLSVSLKVIKADGTGEIKTKVAYLRTGHFADGQKVVICGRVDVESTSSVETSLTYEHVILSGVTNVTAGEPCFDGNKFTNTQGEHLPVGQLPKRTDVTDLPDQFAVVDPSEHTLFIGSWGGFQPARLNPFHGLEARNLRHPSAEEAPADRTKLINLNLRYVDGTTRESLYMTADRSTLYYYDAQDNFSGIASLSD